MDERLYLEVLWSISNRLEELTQAVKDLKPVDPNTQPFKQLGDIPRACDTCDRQPGNTMCEDCTVDNPEGYLPRENP